MQLINNVGGNLNYVAVLALIDRLSRGSSLAISLVRHTTLAPDLKAYYSSTSRRFCYISKHSHCRSWWCDSCHTPCSSLWLEWWQIGELLQLYRSLVHCNLLIAPGCTANIVAHEETPRGLMHQLLTLNLDVAPRYRREMVLVVTCLVAAAVVALLALSACFPYIWCAELLALQSRPMHAQPKSGLQQAIVPGAVQQLCMMVCFGFKLHEV